MQRTLKNGFTLTEMMIVIVIVGAVATFSLVNYDKAQECALYQTAWDNLKTIQSAQRLFFARDHDGDGQREYWPQNATPQGLAAINTNLDINILTYTGMTYACSGAVNGSSFTCSMTRSKNGTNLYTLTVQNGGAEPVCSGTSCVCQGS